MIAAAVSAGNARMPSTDATNSVQIISGIRIIDIPRVRRFRIVVTKFRPPMVKEAMNSAIASSQSVCPIPDPGDASAIAESGG